LSEFREKKKSYPKIQVCFFNPNFGITFLPLIFLIFYSIHLVKKNQKILSTPLPPSQLKQKFFFFGLYSERPQNKGKLQSRFSS